MPDLVDVRSAIERWAPDGALVYIGNFGAQLFSVGHELIRARRRKLRVVMSSGGILLDQLLGAGAVEEAVYAHCWSPVGPSPAWNFRRVHEDGGSHVRFREVSLGILSSGLTAGAWGVPFAPTMNLEGTGYVDEDWTEGLLARASSPFGDAWVVQAIQPDVAFIHVDVCDEDGNGVLRGPRGEVALAAQAAREVVVVTEELVSREAVREAAAAVVVPGILVSAIVVEPFALHPDGAPGRYDRDVVFYEEYAEAARDESRFRGWLQEWVYAVQSRDEYRKRLTELDV